MDNIKMDLREVKFEDVDLIYLAHDMDWWWALVTVVMNIWIPKRQGIS
jgi:hypothetical protein